MIWTQPLFPVAGSLPLSALVAAVPIFTLLILLGVLRWPAWKASLAGLGSAALVALLVYRMPVTLTISSSAYGAAFGLFPIAWVVYWGVALYRITLDTGHFEIIKDSIASLTSDQGMQGLLIAFVFGAFLEGAAGFGAPVAVSAAMLVGLGFQPFRAAALCLLANTAPVAFGSIAVPLVTLAGVTGLPLAKLSADAGRLVAPLSMIIPAYLMAVIGGWRTLRAVLPGAAVCGIAFAATQFFISNFVGAPLTDLLAALVSLGAFTILLRFWKPPGSHDAPRHAHSRSAVIRAWTPYALLVAIVLLWSVDAVRIPLNAASIPFHWPGLHNAITRMPPAVPKASLYGAVYTFNYLAASGTACMVAALLTGLVLAVPPMRLLKILAETARQLALSFVTMAAVLALAFLMNYSGATATLGLAFTATGVLFPFFSALLGWLGVFLTGSDTSSNALFGNLQVVAAGRLGLDAVLMAAANSIGGVMGKMISLQSIAVAAAATGIPPKDESRLFRLTFRHSVLLASLVGLLVTFLSYVAPGWAR